MKLGLKILFDPNGWKNRLLSTYVSSFSHQPHKNERDYLNDQRTTWLHPATKEPSQKSFIDLYEEAKREGINIITVLLQYWNQPSDEYLVALRELINDISYDTGKPLHENHKNLYCEPII